MKYYLGVDGGGTKTTAVVSDENGNIIRSAVGKTINYYSNPYELTKQNFKEIIDEIGIRDYASVCIGMSALSERTDELTARRFTDGILNTEKLIMTSDIEIALNAVDCGGARAILICGTGSMAAAADENGNQFHSGGWGYLLGDEGSGYSIALNAVKKILRYLDDKKDDLIIEKFPNINEYEETVNIYLDDPFFIDLKGYLEDEDYALALDASKGLFILAQELHLYPLYIALFDIYEDLNEELYKEVIPHYNEMMLVRDKIKDVFCA